MEDSLGTELKKTDQVKQVKETKINVEENIQK